MNLPLYYSNLSSAVEVYIANLRRAEIENQDKEKVIVLKDSYLTLSAKTIANKIRDSI